MWCQALKRMAAKQHQIPEVFSHSCYEILFISRLRDNNNSLLKAFPNLPSFVKLEFILTPSEGLNLYWITAFVKGWLFSPRCQNSLRLRLGATCFQLFWLRRIGSSCIIKRIYTILGCGTITLEVLKIARIFKLCLSTRIPSVILAPFFISHHFRAKSGPMIFLGFLLCTEESLDRLVQLN